MDPMNLTKAPIAKAEMLIRRPVAEVYNAFTDPAVTTKFWFTKSSGRLVANQQVQWEWEMYGAATQVLVKALEPNQRIRIEWSDPPTTVEWVFAPHGPDATFVSITHFGFAGDGDAVVEQVIGSTEGFALVLAGLKAFLEHGLALNLIGDRFPR